MRAAECARAGAESKLVVPVLLDLGLRVVAVTLTLVVAARAALAVAADLDAAKLDARDRLIEDQRHAIKALISALEHKAKVSNPERHLDLPHAGCAPSQLEQRYQALNLSLIHI